MRYIEKIDLKYRELSEEESLYDDVDLEASDVIDAQYRRVRGYEGNPDICALPAPRNIETLNRDNYIIPNELVEFRRGDFKPKTKSEYMSLIEAQRRIRCPFPYHEELEVVMLSLLQEVYINRKTTLETREITITCDNRTEALKYRSMTPQIIASPPGFCLLSTSGHGKSAAIELVSRHIPKVIRHKGYVQIPILYLTAFGNRNVTALLKSSARKIDELLDSGEAYENQVKKLKSPADVAELLIRWIQVFHIGMIIIDEVQYLEFGKANDSGSGPNSFANIIHVTEESGVALGVIGNLDAMTNWQSILRDMRRLEEHKIYIDKLSPDKEFTDVIIKVLWKYQVFKTTVNLTNHIIETLKQECHRSIDMLVLLIMAVEYEALFSPQNVNITPDYIHKISKKRFSKMQELIDKDDEKSDRQYCDLRRNMETLYHDTYAKLRKGELERNITETLSSTEHVDRCEEIQNIFNNIHKCHPSITQKVVERAYDNLNKRVPKFKSLPTDKKTPYVLDIALSTKDNTDRREKKIESIMRSLEESKVV